jgi:hypothetical protein
MGTVGSPITIPVLCDGNVTRQINSIVSTELGKSEDKEDDNGYHD